MAAGDGSNGRAGRPRAKTRAGCAAVEMTTACSCPRLLLRAAAASVRPRRVALLGRGFAAAA